MKFMKLTLTVATLGLAVASAASHYSLKLDAAKWAGDKQLKPGEYKVELVGDKVVFKTGKTVVEVPATVQKNDTTYSITSYESMDSNIEEIYLGGTNTRIVFGSVAAGEAAGGK
jgi:hypothetical protein